jgi:CheY-like chemotaxis protein
MNNSSQKLRFLVVDDEGLVSTLIEDTLADLGHEVVAVASRLQEACELARREEFGFAILDVNLDGRPSFPAAEILRDRGVPFTFATGYGASGVDPSSPRYPPLPNRSSGPTSTS